VILRPYQIEAIAQVSAKHKAGHRGVLLVMPTGSGKTVVFARICKAVADAGGVALVLVPRVELVGQTSDKLRRFGVRHGLIAASMDRPDPAAAVQVAMVQTLVRRPHALLRRPSYVVIDEAHLAAADTHRKVLANFPNARILGVTATPFRLDGQGFDDFASDIVVGQTVLDLVDLWHSDPTQGLVPARTYSVPVVDVGQFKRTRNGEFDQRQQAAAYERQQLVGDVVEHYLRHAVDASGSVARRGLIFGASVKHAETIAEGLRARGLRVPVVTGETPSAERAAILGPHGALVNGTVDAVANFGVLCEGFDCPVVSLGSIARATASCALWIQMVGRMLRPSPGKADAIILDHGGNALRHGGIAFQRRFTLHGRDKRDRDEDEIKAKVCRNCAAVMPPTAQVCTVCGTPFVVVPRKAPQTVAGDLVEVDTAMAPLGDDTEDTPAPLPHWQARRRGAAEAAQDWTARLRRVS
jgi:DNA repair protein RadD